eukprot:236481_1
MAMQVLNNKTNIYELHFEQREGEIQHDLPQQQQNKPVIYHKSRNKSTLESIWYYFIFIAYTSYTIIITWTSETIIKIFCYWILLLAFYTTFRLSSYIIKMIIQCIKYVKSLISSLNKRILDTRTNPLVWILFAVTLVWCLSNTQSIYAITNTLTTIQTNINSLKIDISDLQSAVNSLITNEITNLETNLHNLQHTVERGFETLGNSAQKMDNTMT